MRSNTYLLRCVFYVFALFFCTSIYAEPGQIQHFPVTEVEAGQRPYIRTAISDDSGVSVVRAYFKHETGNNYNFVSLTSDDGINFSGELPAASLANSELEYLILVKNGAGEVYKSQPFSVYISEGSSFVVQRSPLKVYTELDEAPQTIPGFNDNLAMDVAESGAKYGAVAQLYSSANAGSAAAATGATNSGTVTAVTSTNTNLAATGVTSASSSTATAATTTAATTSTAATTTAVATTAAVSTTTVVTGVAVAGGVAAAAAAGGGDDDNEKKEEEDDEDDYTGIYTVQLEGSLSENIAGDCASGATVSFSNVDLDISGTTVTLDFDSGTMSGSISNTTATISEGSLDIPAGTPAFDSTDSISWTSFTATWSTENRFTSSSFTLQTYELGVHECSYTSTMSGTK